MYRKRIANNTILLLKFIIIKVILSSTCTNTWTLLDGYNELSKERTHENKRMNVCGLLLWTRSSFWISWMIRWMDLICGLGIRALINRDGKGCSLGLISNSILKIRMINVRMRTRSPKFVYYEFRGDWKGCSMIYFIQTWFWKSKWLTFGWEQEALNLDSRSLGVIDSVYHVISW